MHSLRAPSLLLLAAGILLGGCASSQSAKDAAVSRAAAIGTWKYKVDGFAPLEHGVIRIMNWKGRLRAVVRDQRQGRLSAEVDVHDSRMELTMGDLLISGRIENGQFTGILRRERWDVSVAYRRHRRTRFRSASLYARRVESATAADVGPALECRPIRREANGCG